MTNVLTAAAGASTSYSALFVVLMGLGTVMFGLVCLVFICWLMGLLVRAVGPKKAVPATPDTKAEPSAAPAAPAVRVAPCNIPNRGGFIAAVSAARRTSLSIWRHSDSEHMPLCPCAAA